jgi:Ni,Fe-hydrogenase III small subunit
VRQVDAGSCNACELEIAETTMSEDVAPDNARTK